MDNEFENKYYADDKMGKEYVNKILAKNARGIILLYILIFLSILINWILRRNLSKIYWMIACIVILLLLNFYNQKYLFRQLRVFIMTKVIQLLCNLEIIYLCKKVNFQWN